MPEGDTLFRTAVTLRKALAGKTLTGFETVVDAAADVARRRGMVGRTVEAVEARGKHLLIVFRPGEGTHTEVEADPVRTPPALSLPLRSGDLVLHTHLRLIGSWHVYRPEEPWRKPAFLAKVVVRTADFVAPCFNAPVVELLGARETARHSQLITLGPDAMTPEFDPMEARRRLRQRPDLEISVALMDQRAMAGVGNEFKSEILFIRRVSPFVKVKDLSDELLEGLVEESHRLLRLNATRGRRRTVFTLDNRQLGWVYGRSGQPCRVCGTVIQMRRQGYEARSTYYCHRCQNVS